MKIECLKAGVFSRSTVKPLTSVFDLEKEKRTVEMLVLNGEWFVVSGLRRTGKTTLVRSVCEAVGVIPIYVNAWGIKGEDKVAIILEKITEELRARLRRHRLTGILSNIRRISFLGVSLEIRAKSQLRLEKAIVELSKKQQVVLILDEIQELKKEEEFFKFLAALHDQTAPNLSTVFLGSVVALKDLLEKGYAKPLHGRLGEEVVLSPLDSYMSKAMLRKGFGECGVPADDTLILEASGRLGGFPGWISHFGRLAVLQYYLDGRLDIGTVYQKLLNEARRVVYAEVARAIADRRKYGNYIRILRYLGQHGEITVTEAARAIGRKPNTATEYLEYLVSVGLLRKIGHRYAVADPIVRELLGARDMEKEIKTILVDII